MSSENMVILIGRLGQDPKYYGSGNGVCKFSIATNEKWKDRNSGDWKEHVEWHTIVTFGYSAENCCKVLSKGSEVYVKGKIRTNKWRDNEGNDRSSVEIHAQRVQFFGSSNGKPKPTRIEEPAPAQQPPKDDLNGIPF